MVWLASVVGNVSGWYVIVVLMRFGCTEWRILLIQSASSMMCKFSKREVFVAMLIGMLGKPLCEESHVRMCDAAIMCVLESNDGLVRSWGMVLCCSDCVVDGWKRGGRFVRVRAKVRFLAIVTADANCVGGERECVRLSMGIIVYAAGLAAWSAKCRAMACVS